MNTNLQNDPDISERQLGFAYWFVTHKILLKKIGTGILMAVSSLFLLYGLYGFADYFFITGPAERRLIAQLPKNLVNFNSIHQEAAGSLRILNTYLISSGGKYDLAAKIVNPNEKWRADFDYQFIVDGLPTAVKNGFILPGEEKYVFNLAFDAAKGARNVSFNINEIRWQKIDPHQIPDYSAWKKVRFNFTVSDIVFDGAVRSDSKVFSQAKFKVKNSSAFDFWQVNFNVVLYRGSVVAGINTASIGQFYANSEKDLVATWYESIPGVTRTEVYPEADIFDNESYIK